MNLLPKFRENKPKILFLAGGIFALILTMGINLLYSGNINISSASLSPAQPLVASLKKVDLTDKNTYQGLPVGEVKSYPSRDAWATVVYIPQYHKSPGTDAAAGTNDAGVVSQKEIYQIISFLIDKANINISVVEGSIAGEVPAEKIAFLANKIGKKNELATSGQELKKAFNQDSLNSSLQTRLLTSIDKEITTTDREITLEGASEKLKAEGGKFKLYGSENPATKEEAKLVLRDYLFLQKRISELNKSVSEVSKRPLNQAKTPENNPLLKRLFSRTSQPPFNSLESIAASRGKADLAIVIQKTAKQFNDLDKNTPQSIMLTASGDNPSWDDNPYKNETNLAKLKDKLSLTKQRMEEVVVEKRNQDTAENMAKALREESQTVGILQFGAGHEEGLIKELNSQGLNVIVLTPQEVLKLNSAV